jgi:NDP-sugar pyrophosphorylase family protein
MKAMILAAGRGTRLRPLTDHRPKALVEIGGKTLLEITIARLRAAGVTEIVVNVHHFAEMMLAYLKAKGNFGIRIEVSREQVLLDTGGGLKNATWFFLEHSGDEPFLLHNVDIISAIDLQAVLEAHKRNGALATLAVQKRNSSRQLLFDTRGLLCGRRTGSDPADETVVFADSIEPLAFAGIHVIAPRFLHLMTEGGVFSIIDTYLRLAQAGENIRAFRADRYYWRDLGKPESIRQAECDLAQGVLKL